MYNPKSFPYTLRVRVVGEGKSKEINIDRPPNQLKEAAIFIASDGNAYIVIHYAGPTASDPGYWLINLTEPVNARPPDKKVSPTAPKTDKLPPSS